MKSSSIAVLCLVLAASPASAALQSYPDRASWLAAVGSPTGGENFNGFTTDTPTEDATIPIQGGTLSSVDNTSGPFPALSDKIDVVPFTFNTYFVDNTPYFLAHPELNHAATFQFTTPITAWAADFGRGHTVGIPNSPHIDAFDAAGALLGSVSISPSFVLPDEIQFYGFTITGGAASRIVIDNSSTFNNVFGIDNIQFVAVPEPSTWALATLGVAWFGFARRPPAWAL